MEHRCAWEGEKQKCTTLYEVVQRDRIKYIDGSGREYTDIKSFRNNRTKDIQTDKENEGKRKLDTISHEEDTGKEKQNKN